MSYTNKKDEFGRDIALRAKQSNAGDDYMTNLTKLMSKMSWAEFSYAQDEEEEQQVADLEAVKKAEQKAIQAKEDSLMNQYYDRQKRVQIARGKYELEDGEIIE
jgi:multidrug efflux pump subunit AcrA (membrane-fusion protein)